MGCNMRAMEKFTSPLRRESMNMEEAWQNLRRILDSQAVTFPRQPATVFLDSMSQMGAPMGEAQPQVVDIVMSMEQVARCDQMISFKVRKNREVNKDRPFVYFDTEGCSK